MTCPNCGSCDAYTCRTAYDQGSSHGTYAGGQSSWGGSGGSYGSHSGTITTRTGFARRAAPPGTGIGTALTMVAIGVAGVAFLGGSTPGALAGLVAACGALLFVYRVVTLPRFFRRLRAWRASWICARCSTVWVPDRAFASAG